MESTNKGYLGWGLLITVVVIVGIVGLFWAWPVYRVWSAGMSGRAQLQHADFERQVQVVNAKANLQAQSYNADAEVVRAKGVASANNIIKNSITDQYIKYLWVQTLDKGVDHQIIYVPTELGLPITEAGRASK